MLASVTAADIGFSVCAGESEECSCDLGVDEVGVGAERMCSSVGKGRDGRVARGMETVEVGETGSESASWVFGVPG